MQKITYLYTRVSDKKQIKGKSLEGQKRELIEYCKNNNITHYQVIIDSGYTGRNINRPGFQKMLKNIENVENIVFMTIDRLSRDIMDYMKFSNLCLDYGVNLIALYDEINDTADSEFEQLLKLSLSKRESRKISERTVFGVRELFKQGKYGIGGKTSLGFTRTKDNKLKQNKDIEIVKDIFSLKKEGFQHQEIIKKINKKYNKKYSGKSFIGNIIQNKIYTTGEVKFSGEYYKVVEPVISDFDYEDYRRVKKSYKGHMNYLFNINHVHYVTKEKKVSSGEVKQYRYYKSKLTGKYFNENKLVAIVKNHINKEEDKNRKIYNKRRGKINKLFVIGDINKKEHSEMLKELKSDYNTLFLSDYREVISITKEDIVVVTIREREYKYIY